MTLNGDNGVNPLIPASLKGCAAIRLCNPQYRLSGPLIGLNGMSLVGYGDKLEACLFSFHDGVEQCLSSYEAPFRAVVTFHGPVNAY